MPLFLGVNYVLDWAGSIALNRMVEEVQPDLMLVLGDTTLTARNDIEYERFVRQMDRYEVPWACVFGNHDDEGRADKAKLVDILLTSKNGLFEYGPSDLHGAGNYVIRLTRDGKTEQALFLMDSGSSLEFPEKTDGINENQVAWYQWNMEGFKAAEGGYPKNMSFFHIPLPVYSELDSFVQGERAEDSCPSNTDGGLISAMQRLNGTHLFAAHDHNNNFIAEKDGLKICYAMKSSYNCYFKFRHDRRNIADGSSGSSGYGRTDLFLNGGGIPMKAARVFEKELMIPTYDVGKKKKIPCFLKNGFTRAAPAGCIPIP